MIIVAVLSTVVFLVVWVVIGVYYWRHKMIEKRRKGKEVFMRILFAPNNLKIQNS